MRRMTSGAGLLLVGTLLTACGVGGAPTDASEEEFCDSYLGVLKVEDGKGIREWGEDLEETGTPEGIPGDARDGFEKLVEVAVEIDDDAKLEDLDKPDTDEEEENLDALGSYAQDRCMDAMMEESQ